MRLSRSQQRILKYVLLAVVVVTLGPTIINFVTQTDDITRSDLSEGGHGLPHKLPVELDAPRHVSLHTENSLSCCISKRCVCLNNFFSSMSMIVSP